MEKNVLLGGLLIKKFLVNFHTFYVFYILKINIFFMKIQFV